ncbi:transposase [Candidatus Bathyarchaeota archaeon]|nr:transposase [Candidatus Bathyarchaeota archaeon]MBS7618349.1 transposase [Candidatus Bathyarchaeota archaeon]
MGSSLSGILEYKLKWFGLDVKYVNPRRSSKSCGLMMNWDIVAVLNLQMWGSGFTPKALYEPSRGKNYVSLSKTT